MQTDFDVNERLVVLYAARITFDIKVLENLKKIVCNEQLDWYLVLKYSSKNKVIGLVWYNLKKYGLLDKIPPNINYIFRFIYFGTFYRNQLFIEHQKIIVNEFIKNNIDIAKLKGGALLEDIYADYGMRFMNDLDFIIRYRDREKVCEVMKSLGFVQGRVSINTGEVQKLSRTDEIVWRTKMNNLSPFFKKMESPWCTVLDIDLSFSMDFDRKHSVTDELLNRSRLGRLHFSDRFLHICSHLYKEATNASWILVGSDVNLMKFCDARECIMKIDRKQMEGIIEDAYSYGIEKALYYVIFHLDILYDDMNMEWCYSLFKGINNEYFNQFGEREFGHAQKWTKSFIDRIFEGSNTELIDKEPFFNLIHE